MSNIKTEDDNRYTHQEYQLVLAKQALRDYLSEQNWTMAVTLTASHPCSLKEFLRDTLIFFTQLDKKTYGRSLLDKTDNSNRLQALHPEAQKLWEERARLGLERNKKGYMNGLRRIVMIERAEIGEGKKRSGSWREASGIEVKMRDATLEQRIGDWTQREAAGSNKRKVTSLQDTDAKAWWHIHFLITEAADCPDLHYNKQRRRIQNIWRGMRDMKGSITGGVYVDRIRDKEHSGACVNYITKHIKALSWKSSVVDSEVTDGYWLENVSNMGIDKASEALKEVREALRKN